MGKLLVALLLGTGLWSGYWFAGSSFLQRSAEDWFAAQARQGRVAETTGVRVAGFPNRFDLTVDGVRLADPATGIGWQAPFAQVFAMTWKPWHVIAALPPDQVITLPDQSVAVTSDALRASLRVKPTLDAPLAAAVVEAGRLDLRSTAGWGHATGRLVASISADEEVEGAGDAPNAYVLALDLADLAPDPAAIRLIAEAGDLPPRIAETRLRAVLALTAPLDRHAAQRTPVFAGLTLSDATIRWGEMTVTATGQIAPDAAGFAAGRIDVTITSWRRLVPILVAAGVVQPNLARTVETLLGGLAQETGNPDMLRLPLILADGRMLLGPLPLGEAPRLVPPSG